jgi:hypothetical protein
MFWSLHDFFCFNNKLIIKMSDWNNEESIEFMELYQSQPDLWDLKHCWHKDQVKVNDAWNTISNILKKPIDELKNKKIPSW